MLFTRTAVEKDSKRQMINTVMLKGYKAFTEQRRSLAGAIGLNLAKMSEPIVTIAAEREIDELSKFKIKVSNRDVDLALVTTLFPGLDLTVCGGMDLSEKEKQSSSVASKDKEWSSPYFGLNFRLRL